MDQGHSRTASPAPTALDGAQSVLERVAEDEAAARDERVRLVEHGLRALEPDSTFRERLEADERLVDVRPASRVEHISPHGSRSLTGRLHLTTRRLVLVGSEPLDVHLSTIEELSLVGEQLMVGLGDGVGLCFDITAPRVFRVRTAFAMAQAR